MSNFFHNDSPAMRFLSNLKDLVFLNLIWLVFCIPIVTVGPATTAMYMVARKMVRGDAPRVWPTFFKEFKECFVKSFLISLCLLLPSGLLIFYLFMTFSGAIRETLPLTILCAIATIILGFICSYAYPLTAYFENTVLQTLKNAMLMPMMNPLRALAVTGLNLLPLLLLLLDTELFIHICIIWLLFGFALTAYINCRLLSPFFYQFIPEDYEEEDPGS